MAMTSLGISGFWTAPAVPPVTDKPQSGVIGVSGTPIFGGFASDLGEYRKDLYGLSWMREAEKMRRGDATVAGMLAALRLPIVDAQWTVLPPKDATPLEKEITDFLIEQLTERIDTRRMIRNALLMLPFGCAAHEDEYEVVNGKACLKAVHDRLPLTFYQFVKDPNTGKLGTLLQFGYEENRYEYVPVPASKLAYFSFQQEGDNYYGIPLLRAAYKAWYSKKSLETIDNIAHERNGMGIPAFKLSPGAKAEDIARANAWVQQIAAHQSAGLVHPDGSEFKFQGIDGQTRNASESMQYWRNEVLMVAHATFLALGQAAHGSRSMSETQTDFFALGLGALAQDIADVVNNSTARRLCTWNWGPPEAGKYRQPQLKAAKILSLSFGQIVEAVSKLGDSKVNLIQPDDESEAWVRSELGMPAPSGTPRTRESVTVPQLPEDPAKDPAKIAASAVTINGVRLSREPRGAEKSLACAAIVKTLDGGRERCGSILRDARKDLQTEILQKLIAKPVKDMHRVAIATDADLVSEVRAVLEDVASFGARQVAAERKRQGKGGKPGDASKLRASSTLDSSRDPVGLYAESEVSDFLNQLQSRATRVVIGMKRDGTMRPGEMLNAANVALDEQSDKWIDSVAGEGVNNAFASGRTDGYEQNKDAIASVQYSALLDEGTCEACSSADGEEGETPDDVIAVPNPDCGGGDRCRCVHVYVFADEEKAA